MPWLKDPFDPEGEPLQQVLTSPILSQLEREATSLATMSCLAVLLVHLPIKLASTLAPSLFPLSFYPLDTVTEVPVDMLLLHVCLPFTLPHLNIRYASLLKLLHAMLIPSNNSCPGCSKCMYVHFTDVQTTGITSLCSCVVSSAMVSCKCYETRYELVSCCLLTGICGHASVACHMLVTDHICVASVSGHQLDA